MANGNYEKQSTNFKRVVCVDNKSDFYTVHNDINYDDIVLSIDQDVIELCKEKSIQCVDVESLFSPVDFNEKYYSSTKFIWEIEKSLKISFKDLFDNESAEIVEWFSYPQKILIDQIIFYKRLIEESLNQLSINKIVIRANVNLQFSDSLLLDANVSLLSMVANDYSINKNILIDQTYSTRRDIKDDSSFSFGQVDGSFLKIKRASQYLYLRLIFNKARSFLKETIFLLSILRIKILPLKNKKYFMSIGCREIDSVAASLEDQNIRVIALNSEFFPKLNPKGLNKKLKNFFLKENLIYEDFDFKEYLGMFIEILLINRKKLISRRKMALKIMTFLSPKCIFVQTLSAFNINSMTINSVAKDLNIDVYCWMHGGYGGYSSLSGYDITDYRFTNNHIVYGEAAKASITSNNSILKALYPHKNFNVLILGSPFIKNLFLDKKIIKKSKKKIVLSLPGVYGLNTFYFGYRRPYPYLNWWKELKKIIIALSKFEDRFEIIIKDYPHSPQKFRIKKLLEKISSGNLIYLSEEKKYTQVIYDADILIYPWISTSLIEGLHTEAEIIIFDDSEILPETEILLAGCTIFETTIERFISKMQNYLNNFDSERSAFELKASNIKDYFIEQVPKNEIIDKLVKLSN